METGVSIGSRFLTENERALVSEVREPIVRTPKMALIFDLPIEGTDQVIKFINIHGINFVRYTTFIRHIKQILNEIANYNGPLVFFFLQVILMIGQERKLRSSPSYLRVIICGKFLLVRNLIYGQSIISLFVGWRWSMQRFSRTLKDQIINLLLLS